MSETDEYPEVDWEGTAPSKGDPMALPGLETAVRELVNYCPYTLVATKAVQTIRGVEAPRPTHDHTREQEYRTDIKLGLGIMLVGFFCPIFWGSYFTGKGGEELRWSAIHAGVVALAGLWHSRSGIESRSGGPGGPGKNRGGSIHDER